MTNGRSNSSPSVVLLVVIAAILLCDHPHWCTAYKCSRTPEGHGAQKSKADGRYHIRIAENAARYTPGNTYTIILEGIDTSRRKSQHPVRNKFYAFNLVVELKSTNDTVFQVADPTAFGVFTLMHGNTLAKITCANMITHTTITPKSEIQVLWTAPGPGSGCVAFKATVIEHRDVWYMDDGKLTKEFCEDEQTFDDALPVTLDPCCACTEAKYELTFEGLWSRNTHPKDFPSNSWLTQFSEIIGATHTNDYRFWEYGQQASPGMQQVAEQGRTRLLETEIKANSEAIRTIIKARGLVYPNVTGKTFAVFRVDPIHHLMSFVSMINPSPDWFVGVSRLELCLENCTWVENKVLDLYPWDAGTDSGSKYDSPNEPTNPHDNIRRIKSDQPNDPRSPFYDAYGSPMKPLARLYLLRQRLYEKSCPQDNGRGGGGSGSDERGGGSGVDACATSPWSRFSKCDAECGTGSKTRQRHYLNPELADDCQKELSQTRECTVQRKCENEETGDDEAEGEEEQVTEAACALTEWSDFGPCVPSCGNGTMTKRRKYVRPSARARCENSGNNPPELEIVRDCENPEPCLGDIAEEPFETTEATEADGDGEEEPVADPTCKLHEWSTWSKCSVTCGGGYKTRQRRPRDMPRCMRHGRTERKRCNWTPCPIPVFCNKLPMQCAETGRNALPEDSIRNMWFYNAANERCQLFTWTCGNHPNKFNEKDVCDAVCVTGRTGEMRNEPEESETDATPSQRQGRWNNRRNGR